MFELRKLIEYASSRDILEIAAYYLKNIVLLQAFPDSCSELHLGFDKARFYFQKKKKIIEFFSDSIIFNTL
jgi:hypothetical protein